MLSKKSWTDRTAQNKGRVILSSIFLSSYTFEWVFRDATLFFICFYYHQCLLSDIPSTYIFYILIKIFTSLD